MVRFVASSNCTGNVDNMRGNSPNCLLPNARDLSAAGDPNVVAHFCAESKQGSLNFGVDS